MKTGPRQQQVREALKDAFRDPQLFAVVVSDADIGIKFAEFLAAPGTTYTTAMFNLLEWSEGQNKLVPLIREAQTNAHGNVKLAAVGAALDVLEAQYNAVIDPTTAQPTFGEAERILFTGFDFEDAANWFAEMARHRLAVCRIEPQPQSKSILGYGTGFLIAPDVVMTNDHVAEQFYDDAAKAAKVVLRFDFETGPDGNAVSAGTEHVLHPTAWQVARSPELQLDFALLKLAKPAGEEVVGGRPRGFLTPTAYSFQPSEGLVIIQHPMAAPLKLAIGPVAPAPWPPNRVRYHVNTQGGSSGSPCFTQQRRVAALHHWDAVTKNQGVLMSSILTHLKGLAGEGRQKLTDNGLAHLLL